MTQIPTIGIHVSSLIMITCGLLLWIEGRPEFGIPFMISGLIARTIVYKYGWKEED